MGPFIPEAESRWFVVVGIVVVAVAFLYIEFAEFTEFSGLFTPTYPSLWKAFAAIQLSNYDRRTK